MVGVRHGRIELRCVPARLSNACRDEWATLRLKFESNGENVIVTFAAGSSDYPEWRVEAKKGTIGNVVMNPDKVRLEGLSPDQVIEVVFKAPVADIADGARVDDDGLSLLSENGGPIRGLDVGLSAKKCAIISVIRKSSLNPDELGDVLLASHALHFIAAEPAVEAIP